jgi:DNA-binding transcriptional regulator YdaS (Cro superfamily)
MFLSELGRTYGSQATMARRLGVSEATISRKTAGANRVGATSKTSLKQC